MDNLIVENTKDQMIIRLSKKSFNQKYLTSLIKRLELDAIAQKSEADEGILAIAKEIDQVWWDVHGAEFLKNIKK